MAFDIAQAQKSAILETADASPLAPKTLDQMVSVRLESDVVANLRKIAQARGCKVSDLLREAAAQLISARIC